MYQQLMMGIRFFDLRISAAAMASHRDHTAHCTSPQIQQIAQACEDGKSMKAHALGADSHETAHSHPRHLAGCGSPGQCGHRSHNSKSPSSVTGERKFLVTHSLPCDWMQDMMLQLRDFLLDHRQEVVVIRLGRDWDHRVHMGEAEGDAALNQIEQIIGDLLFDRSAQERSFMPTTDQPEHSGVLPQKLLLPTVEDMISSRQPVALFAELPCSISSPKMFINVGLDPYWANDPTPIGTLNGLIAQIKLGHDQPDPRHLRFAALAVTPDLKTICHSIPSTLACCPTGLKPLAADVNALLPYLLRQDLTGLLSVTVDFPTEHVVRAIMAINLSTYKPI